LDAASQTLTIHNVITNVVLVKVRFIARLVLEGLVVVAIVGLRQGER
jgi:hypothetical protein